MKTYFLSISSQNNEGSKGEGGGGDGDPLSSSNFNNR